MTINEIDASNFSVSIRNILSLDLKWFVCPSPDQMPNETLKDTTRIQSVHSISYIIYTRKLIINVKPVLFGFGFKIKQMNNPNPR